MVFTLWDDESKYTTFYSVSACSLKGFGLNNSRL